MHNFWPGIHGLKLIFVPIVIEAITVCLGPYLDLNSLIIIGQTIPWAKNWSHTSEGLKLEKPNYLICGAFRQLDFLMDNIMDEPTEVKNNTRATLEMWATK